MLGIVLIDLLYACSARNQPCLATLSGWRCCVSKKGWNASLGVELLIETLLTTKIKDFSSLFPNQLKLNKLGSFSSEELYKGSNLAELVAFERYFTRRRVRQGQQGIVFVRDVTLKLVFH